MALKFSKESFSKYDISDLLINIWGYNDPVNANCDICKTYEKWCVKLPKERWQTNFFDFEYVIDMIRSQNKGFINFGKISSADKNKIYFLLDKYKY